MYNGHLYEEIIIKLCVQTVVSRVKHRCCNLDTHPNQLNINYVPFCNVIVKRHEWRDF